MYLTTPSLYDSILLIAVRRWEVVCLDAGSARWDAPSIVRFSVSLKASPNSK